MVCQLDQLAQPLPVYSGPISVAGVGNYGPQVQTQGRIRNYAVMGVWKFESEGSPAFSNDSGWVNIHEYVHSYLNPWVDGGMADLGPTVGD